MSGEENREQPSSPIGAISKRAAFRELRDLLANYCVSFDKADLVPLLFDIDLPESEIDFDGPAANVWHRICVEAAKRDRLSAVVDLAGKLYENKAAEFQEKLTAFENAAGSFWIPPENLSAYRLNENSPYVGLRRFEEVDERSFFGRDAEIAGLLSDCEEKPLTLVIGNSGSGKSSVVRAGLIPDWKRRIGNNARAIVFTPDDNPFESFYEQLSDFVDRSKRRFIKDTPSGTIIREAAEKLRQKDEPWLIFIDQFEEIFTRVPERHRNLRDLFVDSLVDCVEMDDPQVRVILAMRDDFFGQLGNHDALFRITDQNFQRIVEMREDALREVIERPAAEHGVGFEEDLVEKIVAQVGGRPGMLPLMQYALNELWESESDLADRLLNLETYAAIGGVEGALGKKIKLLHDKLSPGERSSLRRIMLCTVELGKTETGYKPVSRKARRTELGEADDLALLQQLVDEEKLLVTSGEVDPSFQLPHEALISAWPEFESWIGESKEAIRIRNRMVEDATIWEAALERDEEKAAEELWSGSRLVSAIELRDTGEFERLEVTLGARESKFLEVSESWREAVREKELKLERKAREAAEKAADEANRRRRLAMWAAAALGLVLVGLLVSLLKLNDSLFQLNEMAEEQRQSADRFKNLFYTGEADAALMRIEEKNERTGRNYQTAWLSTLESLDVDLPLTPPQLQRMTRWDLAAGAFQTCWSSPPNLDEDSEPIPAVPIVFSPEGTWFATGSQDGIIRIYPADNPEDDPTEIAAPRPLEGYPGFGVSSMSIASRGETILVAAGYYAKKSSESPLKEAAQMFRLWDLSNPAEPIEYHPQSGELAAASWTVGLNRDGSLLASGSTDGMVYLWKISHLEKQVTPIAKFTGHSDAVSSLAFSPDRRWLASGSFDKTILHWDLEELGLWPKNPEADEIATLQETKGKVVGRHQGQVMALAFKPENNDSSFGGVLVSGSQDRTIQSWSIRPGGTRNFKREQEHPKEGITTVAYSHDGRLLATGDRLHDEKLGRFGSIRIWDHGGLGKPVLLTTLEGHQGPVFGLAFSPDGRRLGSTSGDGTVRLWDLTFTRAHQGLEYLPTRPLPRQDSEKSIHSIDFESDTNVVCASSDGTIESFEIEIRQDPISPKILAQGLPDQQADFFAVALSPNRNIIATLFDSVSSESHLQNKKMIRLFKLQDQRWNSWKDLEDFESAVTMVVFSPDSNKLATGHEDGSVILQDLSEEKLITVETLLPKKSALITSLTFDRSGSRLAAGSVGVEKGGGIDPGKTLAFIFVWNLGDPEPHVLEGHSDAVFDLAFDPREESRILASASADLTIQLWDVESGRNLAVLEGHDDFVTSLAFSADGETLASGSSDKNIRLWDVANPEAPFEMAVLKGHDRDVKDLAFSPNGRWLASASQDKTVRLWDLEKTVAMATGGSGEVRQQSRDLLQDYRKHGRESELFQKLLRRSREHADLMEGKTEFPRKMPNREPQINPVSWMLRDSD